MKKEATKKMQWGSLKKTSNEKGGNPKNAMGLTKKYLRWKKRQPQKHIRAHRKRSLMKKEATPKTQRGSLKKELQWKKRQTQECKGLSEMTSEKKTDSIPEIRSSHNHMKVATWTQGKVSFTNQTVEGKGDAFWFNHKEPNERGQRNQKVSNHLPTEATLTIF
jgi:hypothetical protein